MYHIFIFLKNQNKIQKPFFFILERYGAILFCSSFRTLVNALHVLLLIFFLKKSWIQKSQNKKGGVKTLYCSWVYL